MSWLLGQRVDRGFLVVLLCGLCGLGGRVGRTGGLMCWSGSNFSDGRSVWSGIPWITPKLFCFGEGWEFFGVLSVKIKFLRVTGFPSKGKFVGSLDVLKLLITVGNSCKEEKGVSNWQMETVEVRAVIKYFCKKGMSPKEIHEDFMETLRKESPPYSTVKKWAAEFWRGRERLKMMKGLGTPKRLPQMQMLRLCTIWSCVTGGKTSKVGIHFGPVQSILSDILGMSKVSARWVPECWPNIRREQAWYF